MSGASASVAPPRSSGPLHAASAWRRLHLVPLAVGTAAFLAGLWAGLARLGLVLPAGAELAEFHGALMIGGFLGTVIALERAVAIGRWWTYAAPALAAVAAIALVAGAPVSAEAAFLLAGILLTVNSAFITARQPALFTGLLTVAAACWVAGTLTWMRQASAGTVAGWWLTFLVLTIVAERLELSRLLRPPRSSQWTFILAVALVLAGAARAEFNGPSAPFSGGGLLVLTAWLIRYDIAVRTIRFAALARFSAVCILAGYFWLVVTGLLLLIVPPGSTAFSYDAIVHAIAIGFVLSMIFGHAPIILPAITGLRVRYHAAAYPPLLLLHLSVLLRVAADLLERADLRTVSGPVTVLALAGYAATLIVASRK